MKKILIGLSALTLLAACASTPQKKVVIMASGKLHASGETVHFEPGTQHNEETLTLSGDKLTVDWGTEKKEYPINAPGTWLLNLQNDTLIGGYQAFGTASTRESSISQEALQERMDSLKQLMLGANVSESKKNHFLAPGTIKKISASDNAILVGPFKGMPASLEPDKNGNVPEVYKFVSNKDARETLDRLLLLLKQ